MGIKVDEPLPSCGANASTQPGTENFYGEVMQVCVVKRTRELKGQGNK